MTDFEVSAASVLRRDARPPIAMDAAPCSGAAEPFLRLRRTVQPRPSIHPVVWEDPLARLGYPTTHGYVRRYWTAVLGPGAVADLLRLATAAARDRSLPRPIHLETLARAGLVRLVAGRIAVRTTVPPLSTPHVQLLPPGLRREHQAVRWAHAHRPADPEAGIH